MFSVSEPPGRRGAQRALNSVSCLLLQKAQNWHTASRDPFARTELRKRAQIGLNKGEARNGLARAVFFSLTAKNCSRSIAILQPVGVPITGDTAALCALASRSFRLVSLTPIYRGSLTYSLLYQKCVSGSINDILSVEALGLRALVAEIT